MSTVLLLGAGASKGTLGECAPISREFGKQVTKIIPNWNENYCYLAAAISFLSKRIADTSLTGWALDKVWGAIDARVKLQNIWGLDLPGMPSPCGWDSWGMVGFELQRILARIFGELLESPIEEATKRNGSIRTEIAKLEPEDCIISLNYDVLTERILDKVGKVWTRAGPCYEPGIRTGKLLLCKPHGSLDWKGYFPESGHPVEFLNGHMKEREITPQCHPCLVAPVPFKSEIIDWALQLNLAPNLFHLLVAQWRFAIDYLSKADKLVVMGYGFPLEDLYARYLFAEAVAVREKDGKLEIQIFEASEQSFNEVKTKIGKIFGPSGCKISCVYEGQVKG